MNNNETLGRAIGSVLAALRTVSDETFTWPSPNSGLALYALHNSGNVLSTAIVHAISDACPIQPNSPMLAALGYRIAVDEQFASDVSREWLTAIDRLAQKDPFPADRQSFGFRPIELLGITVGLGRIGDAGRNAWIKGVLTAAEATSSKDEWARMLLAFACHLAGAQVNLGTELSDLGPSELGLRRWLADMGIAGAKITPELDEAILHSCMTGPINADECARAVVLAISLEAAARRSVSECVTVNWVQDRSRQVSEDAIIQLCRRFHLVVKQLRARYAARPAIQVKDEYDVQDILKAMLYINFDDVRPEEYTPSYGGKSTRMDFLLKSEGIVVEAKMTRAGLSDKEITSQLIDDKERYRAHPDCKTLICLVYDPGGIIKNAKGIEADLSGDEGSLRTLVIINPIGM